MAQQEIGDQPTEELITFLARYTALLEKQLVAVRKTMVSTVQDVMEGVAAISDATEGKKKAAEATLDDTYLTPDPETQVLVDSMQETVTEIFEAVSLEFERGGDPSKLGNSQPDVLLQNRLKRFSARFKDNVQALDQLDEQLGHLLLGMIGALSSDDVIAQRIEHVCNGLNALQIGLNYFLLDFVNRCRSHEVATFQSDLTVYTLKQYTMEAEVKQFYEEFPEQKPRAS